MNRDCGARRDNGVVRDPRRWTVRLNGVNAEESALGTVYLYVDLRRPAVAERCVDDFETGRTLDDRALA